MQSKHCSIFKLTYPVVLCGILYYIVCSDDYLSAMVRSSLRLCNKLSEKLKSCENGHVNLLGAAFSCVLCAIENARSLYEGELGKYDREKALKDLEDILKKWITNEKVIGGSIFGQSVQTYFLRSNTHWKGEQELTVRVYSIYIYSVVLIIHI